jgi:hypothetical protein
MERVSRRDADMMNNREDVVGTEIGQVSHAPAARPTDEARHQRFASS